MSIDFPRANEYLDTDAILVLRTAFELYKRDDLLSDLVAHFRRQADAASGPAEANYPRLALSSILWWSDSKDEAIAELTKVVEASRPESDLRLDLAELIEQQADYAGALAMLDAVQPLDNLSLRRREELALRVAVRTGNIDRARQAAERLFGLRLDTDTQIALSGQMHQLGLHELAEALLGRARRRAGNKASALVGLMLQYQRQDKLDQAVQVAMQILRSTTAAPNSSQVRTILTMADDPAAARSAATSVLARSGRLAQLIDRANEELKKTPNAVQIHQALADYYTAARQPAKARAELIKVAELRPDDVNLRLQVANQLAQEGQAEAAVAHYKVVFKKDPSQLDRVSLNPVTDAFRKAGKLDELLQLLAEGDAFTAFSPYMMADLIQELMADDRVRDRAMAVFRKFWKASPTYHTAATDLHHARRDLADARDVRRHPGRDPQRRPRRRPTVVRAVVSLPQHGARRPSAARSRRSRARAARFLDLAAARGRLDELARDIAAARKDRPDWTAGDFYLAMIDCRSGRYDEARALVRKLADPKVKDDNLTASIYPMYAYWPWARSSRRIPALADEAARPLRTGREPAVLRDVPAVRAGPAPRRPADPAVRASGPDGGRAPRGAGLRPPAGAPPRRLEELARQARVFALGEMAKRLVDLGYASDAVPLYSEAIALADQIGPDAPSYFANAQQFPRQLREGLESVLGGLTPTSWPAIAGRLIADASAGPAGQGRAAFDPVEGPRPGARPGDARASARPEGGDGAQPPGRVAGRLRRAAARRAR